jgi:lysophospholipase L1-like esterase
MPRPSTRAPRAAVVGLVLLTGAALAGCLPYTGPASGPRLAQVGNSLTVLTADEVTALGNARGWRVWTDGVVGESVPARRDEIDRAAADRPDVVVIELGTNDVAGPALQPAGSARQAAFTQIVGNMRSAFASASASGTGCVIWVTPGDKATGAGYSWDPAVFNSLARSYAGEVVAEAQRHTNTTWADWALFMSGHPTWLQSDGIHLTTAGQQAFAQMIIDTARIDCGLA